MSESTRRPPPAGSGTVSRPPRKSESESASGRLSVLRLRRTGQPSGWLRHPTLSRDCQAATPGPSSGKGGYKPQAEPRSRSTRLVLPGPAQ